MTNLLTAIVRFCELLLAHVAPILAWWCVASVIGGFVAVALIRMGRR